MGAIWAIVATVLWGVVYRLDEKLMNFLSPYQLYALHSIAGVAIGIALMSADKSHTSVGRLESREWLWVIVTMLTYSVANIAILHSIKLLAASRSAALEISYPLFVVAFGVIVFGDSLPNIWFVLGTVFIFFGSYIILTKC